MAVSRRDALVTLGAIPISSLRVGTAAPAPGGSSCELADPNLQVGAPANREASLIAIAEVVLPAEADRKAAVAAFASWIDNYKEGADTDHGYGNTRIRALGPSPARSYAAQIAALDEAARAKGASGFAAAPLDARRAIVEQAIADAKVDRLSARPTGAHVATDLMGHYFHSSTAADLCYRANIARDACRGLQGSDLPPKPRGGAARASTGSERIGESEGRSPSVDR